MQLFATKKLQKCNYLQPKSYKNAISWNNKKIIIIIITTKDNVLWIWT